MTYTKSIILFIFSLFSFNSGLTQNQVILNGVVLDAQTQQVIPYVNIGLIGTSIGTVSSPEGNFSLFLNENLDKKSIIRFSFLGYESKEFSIQKLIEMDSIIIALEKMAFDLATIEIRPRFASSKKIGHQKTDTNRFTNFAIGKQPNQNLGAAVGRKFKFKNANAYLDTFGFFIAQNNFEEVRFRVSIYSLKNGRPDKNINSSEIIIPVKNQKKGWIEVDLRPNNLKVKENIAVTIEWIYHSKKGSKLNLPITMPSLGTHFYKYGSQGKWKRFRGMSTAMYLTFNHEK